MGIKGGCANSECCASTGICGAVTFGSGVLDDYGYWEVPCSQCARAYERLHPGDFAWPRRRLLWFDNKEYFAEDFLYSIADDGSWVAVMPASSSRSVADKWGGPRYGDLNPVVGNLIPWCPNSYVLRNHPFEEVRSSFA